MGGGDPLKEDKGFGDPSKEDMEVGDLSRTPSRTLGATVWVVGTPSRRTWRLGTS